MDQRLIRIFSRDSGVGAAVMAFHTARPIEKDLGEFYQDMATWQQRPEALGRLIGERCSP